MEWLVVKSYICISFGSHLFNDLKWVFIFDIIPILLGVCLQIFSKCVCFLRKSFIHKSENFISLWLVYTKESFFEFNVSIL